MDLAFYGDLFTCDRYDQDFRPWTFTPPAVAAGIPKRAENKSQPVPDRILQPMLAACLSIVDTLGPQLMALLRQVEERPFQTERVHGPSRTAADLAQALEEHRSSGELLA
ncbi:hypothetical protein ACWDYK_36305 [Streptomyces anthocyanicus]